MAQKPVDIKIQAHVEVGEMRKIEDALQRQIVQMRLAGNEANELAAAEQKLLDIRKKIAGLPRENKISAAVSEAAASVPGVGPLFTALNGSFTGIASGIGAAVAGFETLKGVIESTFEGIKGVADFAGRMNDLGAQTGQSARDVVVLDQAFRNAGLGSEAVGQSINLLQKALTGVNEQGEPTSGIFDRLGLSIDDLKNMSAIDALQAISEKIAGLQTDADKTRAAFDLFGRSGGRMLSILKDDKAFTTAREMVGQLAENIGSSVSALDNFSDSLGALETKKLQFFAGFAQGLGAGDLQNAADTINKIDLSNAGTQFANLASGIRLTAVELGQFAAKVDSFSGQHTLRDWLKALPVGGILAQDMLEHFERKGKEHQIASNLDGSDLFDPEAWKKLKGKSKATPDQAPDQAPAQTPAQAEQRFSAEQDAERRRQEHFDALIEEKRIAEAQSAKRKALDDGLALSEAASDPKKLAQLKWQQDYEKTLAQAQESGMGENSYNFAIRGANAAMSPEKPETFQHAAPIADRLSQIGGYNTPGQAATDRTMNTIADATKRTAAAVEKLVEKPDHTPPAVTAF